MTLTLYGKRYGYQGINPSDSTPEKHRRKGQAILANNEKAAAWKKQKSMEVFQQMQQDQASLAQNRVNNEGLRRQQHELLANLDLKHKQSQMDRAAQKSENQLKDMQQLMNLTQTGAKFVAEQVQKKQEAQKALWKDNVDKYGLDPNIVRSINALKKGEWNSSMKTTAEYKRLAANGMPDDLIRKIHGIPSYIQIAIKESDAITKTRQIPSLLAKLGNMPLKLGNDTITYNSAKISGDPVKLQHAKRLITPLIEEAQGGPIDYKVKESSGSRRVEDQIWAAEFRDQTVHAKRVAKSQHAEEVRIIFNQQLNQPLLDEAGNPTGSTIHPGQAYLNTIEMEAGGPNASREDLVAARHSVNAMILHDLEYGIGDISDEVKELLKYEHPFKNLTKGATKSIGNQWPTDRLKFENALASRSQHEARIAMAGANKWKAKANEATSEAYSFLYGGDEPPSVDAMLAKFDAYKQNGFADAAQVIQTAIALDGAGGINDSSALLRVQSKIARGEVFPANYAKLLNIASPQLQMQIDQLIKKHDRLMPTTGTRKDLEEWVNASLETMLPSKSIFQRSPTSIGAKSKAMSMAINHYKAYKLKHGYDKDQDALQYAIDMMGKDMDKDKGIFKVDLDQKKKIRNFVNFRPNYKRVSIDADSLDTLTRAIIKDNTLLDTQPVLDEIQLRSKFVAVANGQRGEDIPMSQTLEIDTKLPGYIIEMRQREYYNSNLEEGETPIPEYPADYIKQIQESRKGIRPESIRRLAANNPKEINLAYLESGQGLPYIQTPLNKAGTAIKKNFTNQYGGYNSIYTEEKAMSSTDKGFTMVDATLQEVIRLNYPGAGAYKLTSEHIQNYAEKAGLKLSDRFNKSNQDKLFEVIFRDLGPDIFTENTLVDDSDNELLQSAYQAVTSDKFELSQWRSPAFLTAEARLLLKEMTQNV